MGAILNLFSLHKLFVFLPLFAQSPDWNTNNDLRLRLGDNEQERLTTSLNFWDLVPRPHQKKSVKNQRTFKIMIDAGHGGKDTGAVGMYGIQEKNLVLKIVGLVKDRVERSMKERGLSAQVLVTRDRDEYLTLTERFRRANDREADLFISVHANTSESPKPHGFEVYFLNAEASDNRAKALATLENAEVGEKVIKSKVLSMLSDVQMSQHVVGSSHAAEAMHEAMERQIRPNGTGVRQAPFTVLAGTTMPALLIEVGFISNPYEASLLTKPLYLKRLAGAISTGIIEFLLGKKLG